MLLGFVFSFATVWISLFTLALVSVGYCVLCKCTKFTTELKIKVCFSAKQCFDMVDVRTFCTYVCGGYTDSVFHGTALTNVIILCITSPIYREEVQTT